MPFEQRLKLLKGLKIGVTRAGALTWQLARFNLVAAGLDPDQRRPSRSRSAGRPRWLPRSRTARSTSSTSPCRSARRSIGEGKAISFINNAKGDDPKLSNFLMEGLWTTPDYLAANRATVAAAVGAYQKASQFIREVVT